MMETKVSNKISPTTRRISFLFLVSIFLLALPAYGNTARILAFGDSITSADNSKTGGYPTMLDNMFNEKGKPAIVVNKGIHGELTPQGADRLDSVLALVPTDIVLIMEGVNDIRHGRSVNFTRRNLQKMINIARARGVTPVLATLTPSDQKRVVKLIPKKWNPMITSLASLNGVKLVDHYSVILPYWRRANEDGIHPNETGYDIIAQSWYAAIDPMISANGNVNPEVGYGGGFLPEVVVGCPVERHLNILRDFRDTYLKSSSWGQKLARAYYLYSPQIVEYTTNHENAREAITILLYPLLGISLFFLKITLSTQLILASIIATTLLFTFLYTINQKRRKSHALK